MLLRLFVAGILGYLGWKHLFSDRKSVREAIGIHWPRLATSIQVSIGISELVIAAMFFFGAYTQIAALALMFLSIKILVFHKYLKHPSVPQRLFYVLLIGASLSLLITGAGALAMDLPL